MVEPGFTYRPSQASITPFEIEFLLRTKQSGSWIARLSKNVVYVHL